jgi:chemotaxis protein CheX
MTNIPTRVARAEMIRSATLEVISMMVGLDAEAGDATASPVNGTAQEGVFATVGLAGRCTGSGTISLSAELACKLSSQFLMAEYEQVNVDVLDAVGELANMIVGNVKTSLESEMGAIGLSIPTVVFGKNFMTRSLSQSEGISIPFRCLNETLVVGLYLTPSNVPELEVIPGFVHPHYLPG